MDFIALDDENETMFFNFFAFNQCAGLIKALFMQAFLCPRNRRSGGILFLSCLSFCHSVLLSETLTLLITFEQ